MFSYKFLNIKTFVLEDKSSMLKLTQTAKHLKIGRDADRKIYRMAENGGTSELEGLKSF